MGFLKHNVDTLKHNSLPRICIRLQGYESLL